MIFVGDRKEYEYDYGKEGDIYWKKIGDRKNVFDISNRMYEISDTLRMSRFKYL
jgi:hypothetical protein